MKLRLLIILTILWVICLSDLNYKAYPNHLKWNSEHICTCFLYIPKFVLIFFQHLQLIRNKRFQRFWANQVDEELVTLSVVISVDLFLHETLTNKVSSKPMFHLCALDYFVKDYIVFIDDNYDNRETMVLLWWNC